jgi:hypothetical protein
MGPSLRTARRMGTGEDVVWSPRQATCFDLAGPPSRTEREAWFLAKF